MSGWTLRVPPCDLIITLKAKMVNLPIFLFLNCSKIIHKFVNIEFKPISRVANLNGRMRVSEGGLRLDSQNYFFKILNELTNINFIFMKAKKKEGDYRKKLYIYSWRRRS